MRRPEESGRADGQDGLSPRTVRYVFTILRSALGDVVRHGRLAGNPTDRSTPPTPSQARPPEMHAWTAPELARFLRWAEEHDADAAIGWRLLAYTGMRRGEALALRWRDVDLDAGRIAVRRTLGVVKTKGQGGSWSREPRRPGSRGSSTWTPGRWRHCAPTGRSAAHWRWTWSAIPRWWRQPGRDPTSPGEFLPPIPRARRPGPQGAGGGAATGHPAARPPAHPRDPAAGRR